MSASYESARGVERVQVLVEVLRVSMVATRA